MRQSWHTSKSSDSNRLATATIDWNAGSTGADAPDDTGTVSSTTVGTDADFANDRIRIYDKGFFMVNLGISFAQTGTDTVIWTFRIATDIDTGGSVAVSRI